MARYLKFLFLFLFCSSAHASFFVPDGSITTLKIKDSAVTTAKILDQNVTTTKIADLNVTTWKLADLGVTAAKLASSNFVVSSSSGSFSTTSGSPVPALTVVLTTSGLRPVRCELLGITTNSYIGTAQNASTSTTSNFEIRRGPAAIAVYELNANGASANLRLRVPSSSVAAVDTGIIGISGAQTYTLQVFNSPSGATASVQDTKLICYEM